MYQHLGRVHEEVDVRLFRTMLAGLEAGKCRIVLRVDEGVRHDVTGLRRELPAGGAQEG